MQYVQTHCKQFLQTPTLNRSCYRKISLSSGSIHASQWGGVICNHIVTEILNKSFAYMENTIITCALKSKPRSDFLDQFIN